ncbi:hypothetical protein GXW82_34300 [Streptacidiphilus sp. 4-A2]|nr:hypothetical protein [Streptacidiphilus sp. 4-A2]
MVVSPAALAVDGESVRVARDVLGAAFAMKAVVPGDLTELERVLSRRGRRRLVVIGDDQALRHVVQLLHRHAQLDAGPVGIIPVGKGHKVALARSLGASSRPVEAARAIARGGERTLDLLVDEDGGVVLSGLRIPGRGVPEQAPAAAAAERGCAGVPDPAPQDQQGQRDQQFDPHAACSPRANNNTSGRAPAAWSAAGAPSSAVLPGPLPGASPRRCSDTPTGGRASSCGSRPTAGCSPTGTTRWG